MRGEKLKSLANSAPILANKVSVGVSVLVFNKSNQVLLTQRQDLGWWGFPGGKVEEGETIEKAALRETKEETGFLVKIQTLSGIYLRTNGGKNIVFVFTAKPAGGKLSLSSETKDLNWFSLEEAKKRLSPNLKQRLADALNREKLYIRLQNFLPFKYWFSLKKEISEIV